MADLKKMAQTDKDYLLSLNCPQFDFTPWVAPPPLNSCRIAMISTAGIHLRDDRPFDVWAIDYRIIPNEAAPNDIIMSHVSSNFDRTGFQNDLNVIFPLDLLNQLAEKKIKSVSRFHYSFMGAPEPEKLENAAKNIAQAMLRDNVDAVLLIPV